MWEAIAYVSSGFTLAAFIASVVAWILKEKSEEKGKLIALADTRTKSRLVQDALEFFHVNSDSLNKEQQFNLALEQIKNRAGRFKAVTILIGFLAVLAAALSAYAIGKVNSSSNQSSNEHPAVSTSQEKSITESALFEEVISDPADINKIRQFIDDHAWVLSGAPQYLAGTPTIENVRDLPIQDGLVPNFTRFNFQPRMSQIPNYIIFFDFISPDVDIFDNAQLFTAHIEKRIFRMEKYISSGYENYNEYTESAAQLTNFSIPLSTMQGYFGARFEGVIVVGRRSRLSVQQIEYLSTFNKDHDNDVKIITYDALLEYMRSREEYMLSKEGA